VYKRDEKKKKQFPNSYWDRKKKHYGSKIRVI